MRLDLPHAVRQAASQGPLEVQDATTADRFYLMSHTQWERIKMLLEVENVDPSFYEATDIEVFGSMDAG